NRGRPARGQGAEPKGSVNAPRHDLLTVRAEGRGPHLLGMGEDAYRGIARRGLPNAGTAIETDRQRRLAGGMEETGRGPGRGAHGRPRPGREDSSHRRRVAPWPCPTGGRWTPGCRSG